MTMNELFRSNRSTNATAASNPFAFAAPSSPFADEAAEVRVDDGEFDETHESYALVAHGPSPEDVEVEDAVRTTVEVMVQWGGSVLHVAHLSPPRGFYVGEESGRMGGCDYLVPVERLGATRAPLVRVEGGRSYAVILPGAEARVESRGGAAMSLSEAVAAGLAGPCAEMAGAFEVALHEGVRVWSSRGGFSFVVRAAAAGKRVGVDWRRALAGGGLLFVGLSFVAHTALLAGMAYFKPTLALDSDQEAREQNLLMGQMLKASAEAEQERKLEQSNDEAGGNEGARAAGVEGVAGTETSHDTNRRAAQKGPANNPEPRLSRRDQIEEARHIGMIDLLLAANAGPSNAAGISAWGDPSALGRDAVTANGGMFGEIGDSFGNGGLGLSGIGDGGGGQYGGLGLGRVGTIGGGQGTCGGAGCGGVGHGHGMVPGDHKTSVPRVTVGTTQVTGHIPPEVIQRIVRQNYGRFRLCYEGGLKSNPSLQGRVAVRFVIGRDGAVANVSNSGSDLPDSGVVSCVVRSFGGLSFPQPDNGIVTVVYPISFTPGG